MYFNDHNPPLVHVNYARFKAAIMLDGHVLEGQLPPKAMRLVMDWIDLHQAELKANWKQSLD